MSDLRNQKKNRNKPKRHLRKQRAEIIEMGEGYNEDHLKINK